MLKIMVCDDDPFIFEQLREEILSYCVERNREYQLTCCAAARELLEAPFDYDILFLDIMLDGGIDGISVGKQLREAGNSALFCIITSRKDRAIDGYQATVFRYLLKPVQREEFRRTLDALVDALDYSRVECSAGAIFSLPLFFQSKENIPCQSCAGRKPIPFRLNDDGRHTRKIRGRKVRAIFDGVL